MTHGHPNKHALGSYPHFRSVFYAGFSLVELSIVLVILGLLVGGILGGKSLIRAAELRSVVTQHDKIFAAVQGFKDKYMATPGDFNNAISFWGAANAASAVCAITASTNQKTCNGDGDGLLYPTTYDPGGGLPQVPYEGARFWQHLANAGMIEGQYTGLPLGFGYFAGAGAGVSMQGRLAGSYWAALTIDVSSSTDGFYGGGFTVQSRNSLILGVPRATFSTLLNPSLSPPELWNIDTKIDDGKPASGKVVVSAPNGLDKCTDTNTATTLTANYLLTSDDITCNIIFRQQF